MPFWLMYTDRNLLEDIKLFLEPSEGPGEAWFGDKYPGEIPAEGSGETITLLPILWGH